MRAQLRAAYCQLAERSRRCPYDLGGLIGQAWLHSVYCAGYGVANIHYTSAFLPWHRAFTYFHERLLQRALHDDSFRLPVWDWETDPKIPWIYRNWLKIPGVDCKYCRAERVDGIDQTTLRNWLLAKNFTDFGGGRYGPSGNAADCVHSLVHCEVGGYMPDFRVAAMDPIFYVHHTNVDRYWCAWAKHYGDSGAYKPGWPTDPFVFYDVDQGLVCVHADQLLNTKDWGYEYKPPDIPVFAFTSVDAGPKGSLVSIDPGAILPLLFDIAQLLNSAKPASHLNTFDQVKLLLLEIVKQFPLAPFPFDLRMKAPALQSSQCRYGLALSANGTTKVIGTFTMFAAGHAHHHTEVATQISITTSVLSALTDIFTPSGATMTYGILSPDGSHLEDPQVPDIQVAEMRYPTSQDDLKKLLGTR
jgi:hypothetical protein